MREIFLWVQAQGVGVPLEESNAPTSCEGNASDAVDVPITESGTLTVATRRQPPDVPNRAC